MSRNVVWIVSYIKNDYVGGQWVNEQIVTPFNNEEAANKMYEYYEGKPDYVNVALDRCEVFSNFFTPDEVEKMTPEELEKVKLRDE
jgi:hypothetical protein